MTSVLERKISALISLALFLLACQLAPAQSNAKDLIAHVESVALGTFDPPKLYFLRPDEASKKNVPILLDVTSEARGSANIVPAPHGRVILYNSPACDAASRVAEIPIDPKNPTVLQLFYLDASGDVQSMVMQDAPLHKEGQIRVINVSGRAGGIRVNNVQLPLGTGEDKVLPLKMPASKMFEYRAGWEESKNQFYETGTKELFFPSPAMRLTVVLANVPSQREKSNGEMEKVCSPRDYRFYDRVRPTSTAAPNTPAP